MSEIRFDDRFVRSLPGDPETRNFIRQVEGACYSKVAPALVSKPQLVAHSSEVAKDLGLSDAFCQSPEFAQIFSGNKQLPGMQPFAMCYGGHQFGNWAGQLGDGRAINLGELINPLGERFMLQLKGAGPTPYSRSADGLAVLRSSIREFLCSEAMHHLGVPTTRALSLISTGDYVLRDMFYDGHPEPEPGAIVCRVAPSFVRFGSFEIFASRGETEVLQKLVDYTITTDFPHLAPPSVETYLQWFAEVCNRTAELIVHWMRVGFVHGVMNTDNMSITGLTLDYGPYGWLDDYDPGWTPNTTDAQGRRYRYGHQAQVALWNLQKLAQAIYPLIRQTQGLEQILNQFAEYYNRSWSQMMVSKLGLSHYDPQLDDALVMELLDVLKLVETDMTIFYRRLSRLDMQSQGFDFEQIFVALLDAYYQPEQINDDYKTQLSDWLKRYHQRCQNDVYCTDQRRELMQTVNPKYVLRNYLAQQAIEQASEGDFTMVNELLEVMRRPYDEQPDYQRYAKKRPPWARNKPGCSMLSCSS